MRSSRFSLFPVAAAMVAIALIGVACSAPASAPTAPLRPGGRGQRAQPGGDRLPAEPQRGTDPPAQLEAHAGPRATEADGREVRRAGAGERRRVSGRDHADRDVASATERGRRDQGLRRDRMHRRALEPSPEHERAVPRRAHPVAGVGPHAARHGTGIDAWSAGHGDEETGCDIGLAHDPDGPMYHAVVLAAYSASGHSIFAIAEPARWWQPGPNDVIC